jgi:hypothetical protein
MRSYTALMSSGNGHPRRSLIGFKAKGNKDEIAGPLEERYLNDDKSPLIDLLSCFCLQGDNEN